MGRRHRRPEDGSDVDQPSPHSAEDLDYLESFCKDLHVEEVELGDWLKTHHSLDLTITLTLSCADLLAGDKEITVQWTRSIREQTAERPVRKRESHSITVLATAKHGEVMVLKGRGDQLAKTSGDLKIIIHIK